MNKVSFWILLMALGVLASCGKDNEEPAEKEKELRPPLNITEYNQVSEGLKDYYDAGFFDVGVAITPDDTQIASRSSLIKRHYNSLTAENVMKWNTLQPTEGNFNFSSADKIVDFAVENGMKVRGHTLVWHSQVPDWIFKDNGQKASKELVLQRMKEHITKVMTHFKGKVFAWDVVNEAIDDGGSTYRYSSWYEICGEDFIFEAFRTARSVDPDAKLFYNDYSAVNPTKRDKIFDLAKRLNDEGLIDGIGLQAHWNVNYPSADLIVQAIQKYASLGLEVQFTELDVSVYGSSSNPETTYTAEVEQQLADAYFRIFNTFKTYRGFITSVTFWGLTDDVSWLNYRDGNKDNFPLLFNKELEPKQAYFDIINL